MNAAEVSRFALGSTHLVRVRVRVRGRVGLGVGVGYLRSRVDE